MTANLINISYSHWETLPVWKNSKFYLCFTCPPSHFCASGYFFSDMLILSGCETHTPLLSSKDYSLSNLSSVFLLKSIIENLFKPRTKALLIQPHDKKRTHHRHALSEYNHSQLQPKAKNLHLKAIKMSYDCYAKPKTTQRKG